ncbi:hypothetical protein JCM15765_03900 [Paradesulfitobacterium aromaticivorans]
MDTILTLQQIENALYAFTCQLLGLNPDDPGSFDKVRMSWPTGGAPAWGIDEDVVFLRIKSSNDPYVQQRDTTYSQNTVDLADEIISYTRAHQIYWIIYGPNSYENAEAIRNGLYKANLSASNLYLQLGISAPTRIPELFSGRWWSRTDLVAESFEKVTRQGTVPYIKSTNIQIKTEGGITEDANPTT